MFVKAGCHYFYASHSFYKKNISNVIYIMEGGKVVYNEWTVTTCMSAPRKALTSCSELPGRMTEALSSFSRAPATRQPYTLALVRYSPQTPTCLPFCPAHNVPITDIGVFVNGKLLSFTPRKLLHNYRNMYYYECRTAAIRYNELFPDSCKFLVYPSWFVSLLDRQVSW